MLVTFYDVKSGKLVADRSVDERIFINKVADIKPGFFVHFAYRAGNRLFIFIHLTSSRENKRHNFIRNDSQNRLAIVIK